MFMLRALRSVAPVAKRAPLWCQRPTLILNRPAGNIANAAFCKYGPLQPTVGPLNLGLRSFHSSRMAQVRNPGHPGHEYKYVFLKRLTKGWRHRANRCYKLMTLRGMKAMQHMQRTRRQKKAKMRALWMTRINAATRMYGINYSRFMHTLQHEKILLNRKVLAQLAVYEPLTFKSLVNLCSVAGNVPLQAPSAKNKIPTDPKEIDLYYLEDHVREWFAMGHDPAHFKVVPLNRDPEHRINMQKKAEEILARLVKEKDEAERLRRQYKRL
eukprot:Clim_evm8s23 gene=Clim_evmTU8s23